MGYKNRQLMGKLSIFDRFNEMIITEYDTELVELYVSNIQLIQY